MPNDEKKAETSSAHRLRAWAESVEKITPISPDPFSVITIKKTPTASPAANPPIILPNLVNNGSLTSAIGTTGVTTATKKTVIGQDFETGLDIAVSDMERCGGFYVLGQPRTGKSNLLVSMALQDIKNGHGLLFIDPHTDAINDLLARIPETRLDDVIFLDPTRKDRSFGINLLHCTDPTDPMAIEDTWGRIRDIFVKLWEQETGQLGFWVDKILRNSVYLLVETGDYSMVEVPLLLEEDTTFRNSLLKKITVKPFVKDFWYKEIDRLTRRDRTQQVDPALNRLGPFRDNEYLRCIVGQPTSTIDFQRIMAEKRIVLLLLPANLTSDVKGALGTMVLSELLYALNERAKLDKEDRSYFGVYCDEFQEFATPDFAKLFTQTGKFNAMPVVAHQTREQFKSRDDPNRGATAASPSKAFFTLSPIDANEMPLVFAKEPPSETRLEEQLCLSQNPVRDLLHGHTNPDIRKFVNKYLRRLEDKREDIKADMEGAKFARMIEHDTAAFFGAEAQEEGVLGGSHYSSQVTAIQARQTAILRARMHAIKLDVLQKKSNLLRVTIRGLDRFLTEVMEGEKRPKQEAFSDFLIDLAASYSAFPEEYAGVLGLYIKLSYGDAGKHRQIPFDLARSQGLFSQKVTALTFEAEKKTEEERRAFRARFIPEEEQVRAERRKWERERKPRDRLEAMEGKISLMNRRCSDIGGGRTGTRGYNIRREEDLIWYPANVYTWFVWMRVFPDIEKLVIPYRTAKFTETWKYLMDDGEAAKTIAKIGESLRLVKPWEYGFEAYMEYMKAKVARDLKDFLHRYQEGALVMLALLDCAGKGGWRGDQSSDISLSEFPGIEGQEPVGVWCLIERLRGVMREAQGERKFSSVFSKYLDGHIYTDLDDRLDWRGFQTSISWFSVYDFIKYRKDVQSLEALLSERWGWFVRHHFAAGEHWKKISAPIRYYVLCRAADIISFGDRYSSLPPAAFAPYEELVGALVALSNDTKARRDEAEEKEAAAIERQRIEEECAKKVKEISYNPPAVLEARVLDAAQIRAVRDVCIKVIEDGPKDVYETARTIDEFARFCVLLAEPENHIKVRSTQYVEKPARSRTEIDMVNEAARLLSSVAPYTAYVRLEKKEGETGAWTGKVRMEKLAGVADGALQKARRAIEGKAEEYTRPREKIRQEIEERRNRIRPQAPSVRVEAVKEAAPPQKSVSEPEEEPPPRRAAATKKAQEKKVREDEALRTQGEHTDAGDPVSQTQANIKSALVEDHPDKPSETGGVAQRESQSVMESPPQTTRMRLVYRSDFTQPTGWDEEHSEHVSVVRYDGFYHIAVFRPTESERYYSYFNPPVIMESNFLAKVDVCINGQSGENSSCGLVFNIHGQKGDEKWLSFLIMPAGFFCLDDQERGEMIQWRESKHINTGEKTNTLVLVREGDLLTLGVNGHVVAKPTCSWLTAGKVGLFVGSSAPDLYAEGGFRNFELFNLV